MRKQKLVLTAAITATALAGTSPSMAALESSHIQSLSQVTVAVDEFGRPTVNGQNIADRVVAEAKKLRKLAFLDDCNCSCKPKLATT